MTTRNSTSAQLTGKKLKKNMMKFAIALNVLSAIMIAIFVMICKL